MYRFARLHPERKTTCRQQGFTLLEVLIALTALAVGILAVLSLLIASIKGNASAIGFTEASSCTTDRIERLLTVPYTDADLSLGAHPAVNMDGYNVSWNVANGAQLNTKLVTVTVTWNDGSIGRTFSYQFIKSSTITL